MKIVEVLINVTLMIRINMCTGTVIKHVYWGSRGLAPRQAVTSAEGTAKCQRVPCHRHRSKACLIYKEKVDMLSKIR